MRKTHLLVSVVASLHFLLSSVLADSDSGPRPNILFIIADDCTYRDIGCYGGQAHTPHIDGLAAEGMRFESCFQAAPMCSPTRHNIFTGLYPVKSGAYPNHTTVSPETLSVVQYLTNLGYRVAQSGKQHVAPKSVFNWEHIPGAKNPEFDRVDAFLANTKETAAPFALFLCSNEPHTPWNKGDPSRYPPAEVKLPPNFVDTPETRDSYSRYLAEITYFDDQVGQALTLLEKHDLAQNTLVVVTSEQGNAFPFAKWTCYDSGLQSALLVRWPGKVAAGSTNHAMVEYVDFLPTFIEVAGGEVPTELDGRSLLPVLAGKQTHKQYVFGEMTTRGINHGSPYYGIRSIRSEDFKYIWNFSPEVEFQNTAMRTPEFESWIREAENGNRDAAEKVRRYKIRPEVELYDIRKDPLEWTNLADNPEYAEVRTALRTKLDAWMTDSGDLGQATELDALNHTVRNRNKKSK